MKGFVLERTMIPLSGIKKEFYDSQIIRLTVYGRPAHNLSLKVLFQRKKATEVIIVEETKKLAVD